MTQPNTTSPEKALRLRARIKKKKPEFARPESWRYVRLKETWRKPRGLDNKVRKSIKGWPPHVSSGFRGPKVARHLHPSGYREIIVCTPEQLKGIDPKTQAIRIGHTVGKRKRAVILAGARKKKITILNVKEIKETPPEEKELPKETEKEEKAEEVKETEEKEKPKQVKKTKKTKRRTEEQ